MQRNYYGNEMRYSAASSQHLFKFVKQKILHFLKPSLYVIKTICLKQLLFKKTAERLTKVIGTIKDSQ